jgi:mannose-1-phosphate guanylyltransferase/mannose-6-phosphate isomerase
MYGVILAGGGGTRLWPLSRRARPKPFLPLLGDESLFAATLRRLAPLIDQADIYVVAEERHLPLAQQQAPWLTANQLIGEPVGRNTSAAVALAALHIDRPNDDVMAVLPADHRVADEDAFRRALATAGQAAADGALVTLGIRPTEPVTGYGYIVAGDEGGAGEVRAVDRFVEKPTRERAEELLRHPNDVWWNAGIFVWRRDRILEALERHAAQVLDPLRAATDLVAVYPSVPSLSIDYAVMEPAAAEGKVKVVPMDAGWSDVGDWRALRSELASAVGQVVSVGRSEDLGSSDVLVHSSGGRLVVTIGLRDTIVVDTPDVVLVADANRTQEVRAIVERLAAARETDYL